MIFNRIKSWFRSLAQRRLEKKYDACVVNGHSAYKLDAVKIPANIRQIPRLSASPTKFFAPVTVDLRDYCTQTENQGQKPWCAAYSAAGFAENIYWRKNDMITQIDPGPIYKGAKLIDGDPTGDGTSLTAVLQVLLKKGYFDSSICRVQVIYDDPNFCDSVKYAIHKFGCCLLAMNITEEWYLLNANKTSVTGSLPKYTKSVGGHAVLCCGYNRDGVIIHNSWGEDWGDYGFALITWDEFKREFIYAAVLSNCLNGMKLSSSNAETM